MEPESDTPECEFCGWPQETLNVFSTPSFGTPNDSDNRVELCDLCYSSHAGNAALYPRSFDSSTTETMRITQDDD